METLELEYDDVVLRVDRGIFELFHLDRPTRSFRIPLAYLGVRVTLRRRIKSALEFGSVKDRDLPMYGANVKPRPTGPTLTFNAADEPKFRAFFTEAARQADRPLEP